METFAAIVRHTPGWVFAILAVLIVTGVQALRARDVPLWRVFLVPGIFIVWGIAGIIQRSATDPKLSIDWIGALVAGAALGWLLPRLDGVSFHRQRKTVSLPGSPVPLIRNVSIFIARYCLAVAGAFAATTSERASLITLDVAVAGLMTGYFLGWLGRFARLLRGAQPSRKVTRETETQNLRGRSQRH